jgi:hypothetical protein
VYTAPTAWIDIGGSGGPVSSGSNLTGSISCTNSPSQFNSFSTFTLGNMTGGSNVLPMNLLYFRAIADGSQTDLSWATGTESNSQGFVVERSQDGATFSAIDQVSTKAVNGVSSQALYYATTDKQPYGGVNYYRLKHLDLDGGYTYSAVVAVSFDKRSALSVFPNPAKGTIYTIYVKGIDVDQTSVKVEWYDMSGRMLSQQTVAANYGTAQLNPTFNNGVYVLKVVTQDGVMKVQNVIIMK